MTRSHGILQSAMVKIAVAEPKERFLAATIDFFPPLALFLFAFPFSSGLAGVLAILGSVYLIFRDVLGNGQSLGKRFTSLQVVDAETDRVPDPMSLILRNLGFGVPGLNVLYAVAEGVQVLRQPQGLRFGDMFAQTGVVKVPAEDRAKLLVPPAPERPSRPSNPKSEESFDPTAATAPGMTPDSPASAGTKARPIAEPPAPKRAPHEPIDLPPETPKRVAAPEPSKQAPPADPAKPR